MKHQEQQFNSSLEEEINVATRRRSLEFNMSLSEAREKSYKLLAEQIIEKAKFLMHIAPWQPSTKLAQAVINFVLHPVPLATILGLIRTRYVTMATVVTYKLLDDLVRLLGTLDLWQYKLY